MILGITTFLVVNTYYDGKYTKMLSINQKYFKMAMFAFVGFSMYLLIKKNPKGSKSMLQHANALIRYMPVDRETADLISPIFDFTNAKNSMDSMTQGYAAYNDDTPQQRRMLNSGGNSTKRSVSETKKKFVAAQQNWKCASCSNQLPAWFEVDHKIRLEYGGSNHVDNLVALCRDCHGRKTAMENL